jgi:hypothetical protein
MASRSRDIARRRSARAPGVIGAPAAVLETAERPLVQHGVRGRVFISWRVFSGLIVLSLVFVLFMFFSADAFYVHTIAVGGLDYMTKEEIFALADIANTHIFWIDPQIVRQSILRSPTIADASVYIGWPPNMVQIVVQERAPALVWEQDGIAVWIDLRGKVMRQRENRPDLLRISADSTGEPPVDIAEAVVNGALQLRTLYPNIEVLRYNPDKGLGYSDGRGWMVWFGAGTDMPEKLLIYNAVVADLAARGIFPTEINVGNPDAPYYSVLLE